MPPEPRDVLSSLSEEDLASAARENHIDLGPHPDREELLAALLALPNAQEVAAKVERRRLEVRLGNLSARELRALGERHHVGLQGIRRKADLIASLLASPAAPQIVAELDASAAREKGLLRDQLVAARDSIREAANLGATVGGAEDAWKEAATSLDRGDYRAAEEQLARTARLTVEARERRLREIEEALVALEDRIAESRHLGAEVAEAERLRDEARSALDRQEYLRAGDLVKRAERAAMESQQRQIARAFRLRESQVERAQGIIAACESILQEGESYGLDVAEVRTLLRQARDVLARGDTIAGLTFARNAEEAAYRLEVQLEEERRRRGILKPRAGICGACHSSRLAFYDDGWGACEDCGSTFRWRAPIGVRERFRALLGM